MNRLLALLLLALGLGLCPPAQAQQVQPPFAPGALVCAYNSSLPSASASGVFMLGQCDIHGQLLVSGSSGGGSAFTVSHASTTSLATALSAKASSGFLLGFNCSSITGAAAGFCIAYNGAAAPSTGALTGSLVLDFCYFDTTSRGCSLGRSPSQVAYSAGIQILITSAASPYTYTTGVDTAAISADFQ